MNQQRKATNPAGVKPGTAHFVSGRNGFGQHLRRSTVLPSKPDKLDIRETEKVIVDLLTALRVGGLVVKVQPSGNDTVPGCQLAAAAMLWRSRGICGAFP